MRNDNLNFILGFSFIMLIITTPIMFIIRDGVDCNTFSYSKIAELQQQYPKIEPFVDEVLEDGKMTWREYDRLLRKVDGYRKKELLIKQ